MGWRRIKQKKKKSPKFIMRIDPEVDEAVDQALVIAERGNIRQAEKIISELLRDNSDIHTVQFALGVVCGMKGQYGESIAYFDKAIAIFPYFVEAWFNKGASHQKNLEVEEMIRAFQKVVELGDPTEDFVRQAKTMLRDFELKLGEDKGLTLEGYLKGCNKFNEAFAAMVKFA